eukprot:404111_1
MTQKTTNKSISIQENGKSQINIGNTYNQSHPIDTSTRADIEDPTDPFETAIMSSPHKVDLIIYHSYKALLQHIKGNPDAVTKILDISSEYLCDDFASAVIKMRQFKKKLYDIKNCSRT